MSSVFAELAACGTVPARCFDYHAGLPDRIEGHTIPLGQDDARDLGNAHHGAQRIDAGQAYINEYLAGGIALPFGGNKMSGSGREKGADSLRTCMKLKSVAARIAEGQS